MANAAQQAGVSCAAGPHESRPAHEPRQRRQLHAVVRRAGKAPGRTRRGTRGPPSGGAPRAGGGVRRHGRCAGHGPTGRTEGPPATPAPGARPHGAPPHATPRARHAGGHARGRPRRGAPRIMRLPIPTGATDGSARTTPPRSCRHGSPPMTASRAAPATRYPPAPYPDPGPTGRQTPATIHCRCGTG